MGITKQFLFFASAALAGHTGAHVYQSAKAQIDFADNGYSDVVLSPSEKECEGSYSRTFVARDAEHKKVSGNVCTGLFTPTKIIRQTNGI